MKITSGNEMRRRNGRASSPGQYRRLPKIKGMTLKGVVN
jgi:hypothetical protein